MKMINKKVIRKIYTVKMINKEVNPTTCMTNKIVIKKEVKHTTKIYKNVIETAPQVLATYHTSPGWELTRYKIKGSTTVQMIDKDITYDDETIDIGEH
jgi:hypothetical protein